MANQGRKYLLGMCLALAAFCVGIAGPALSQQSCGTVKGVADFKEGSRDGGKAQYWINGFPGKTSSCSYTLELCFVGNGKEVGAKTFMTDSDGRKQQSSDHILNCNNGWSHFFDGQVAGAQEILAAIDGGYLNVRFVGKPLMEMRR